jgi:cytochrome c-type biogenesis protein CcmH
MIVFWILAAAVAAGVGAFIAWPIIRSALQSGSGAGARPKAVALGAAAPALAFVAYLFVGAPELATLGPSAADAEQREIAATLAGLRAATAAAPEDAAAWRRLASAELAASDYEAAAGTFARLIALDPEDTALRSAYGEVLVLARGGVVGPEARAAFETARAGDPGDVRAAFYLAEAAYQAGRPNEAVAAWGALAERAPPGAPWLGLVAQRLIRALQMQERSLDSLGLAPATVAALEAALSGRAAAPRGPSDADVAAAADMDPAARAAMIEGMVASLAARLEAEPDDIEGWRMLARSYRQIGRDAEALEALGQVRRLAPEDLQALRDYAYGLWLAGIDAGPADAATVAALEELLARDERDPVALLALADVARLDGDEDRARTLLTRLIEDEAAPPPLREEARRQLDGVPAE